MKFNRLNRKVHYWATLFVSLPLLVIICTGLLLQVKKQSSWIQPAEQAGTGSEPGIELSDLIGALRVSSELNVDGWTDVDRVDIRPDRGLAKVRLHSGFEVQVDLGTGEILQIAVRRSDLIESLHDGSFFGGDWVKLGLFLPAGIVLFIMLLSGIWMFWLPISRRRSIRTKSESSRDELPPRPRPRIG